MLTVFTPAHQMPWTVTASFQMLPGMQRHAGPVFDVSAQDEAYQSAKRQARTDGYGHVGQADPAVLQSIAQQYQMDTGRWVAPECSSLVETVAEDFVILHDEVQHSTDHGIDHGKAPASLFRVRFLSVCFASNWLPAQKLGLNFAQIHEPVADNQRLMAAQAAIESMAFRQTRVRRHVWLLSPNPALRQDPEQRQYSWQALLRDSDREGARLLERVMFRVERQTTLPLPSIKRAVFFIRIQVCPLHEMLALDPTRAPLLAAALQSMSPAVLKYRGLLQAQPYLLRALKAFT